MCVRILANVILDYLNGCQLLRVGLKQNRQPYNYYVVLRCVTQKQRAVVVGFSSVPSSLEIALLQMAICAGTDANANDYM